MPPREYADLDERKLPHEIIEQMRLFAREGRWPIHLTGEVGVGKSFLAAFVFAKWQNTAAMFRYADLIAKSIRLSKDGEGGWYTSAGVFVEFTDSSWWRHLETVGLLVIDELGSGLTNEWRNEILWKVLEVRKGRPLIMTSNLALDDIRGKFDSRIESRLLAGSTIEMTGRDLRIDGIESRVARINASDAKA